MSMPSFPPNGANMTREEALTMIIASIAMEELALSHILNAEGEKLQYILGTLPSASPRACPQDVLAVNKSVTALVEAVTQNQMLLKNKLNQVLEVCPLPPPPPPCRPEPAPCPPPCPQPHPSPYQVLSCGKGVLHLAGQQERMPWKPGCRLPWRQCSRSGSSICWDRRVPAQIQLCPGKTYMIQYTLNVCTMSPGEGAGTICLRQSPCDGFAVPLCFSLGHGIQTLQYVSVLHPCVNSRCALELSLVLESKAPLCVERAEMDVVEL